MIKTQEGKAIIYADKTYEEKISKQLEVFYNPIMKSNRDISLLVLNAAKNMKLIKDKLIIGLPLAGSGIRGIRFLLETSLVKGLYFNDEDKNAFNNIKKNIKLNNIKTKNIFIENKDANIFLLQSKGFDYIELDPFGSPNKFLDSAIKRLSRNGILAVTATDTAALTGTYPKTTKWKYWANNYLNPEKHEIGLRILIRKVQLMGMQYERALIPVISYFKDHYYRVFFLCRKSKTEAAKVLDKHEYYLPHFCKKKVGPLWIGGLQDKKLLKEMIKLSKEHKLFLKQLLQEENVATVGFIDMHEYGKHHKPIKHDDFIAQMKEKGHKAARTHFSYKGVKVDCKF